MRFLNIHLIITLLLFVSDALGIDFCSTLVKTFVDSKSIQNEFQLPLQKGAFKQAPRFSEYYTEIDINLSNYDNLDHLAWILSRGKNSDEIKQKLIKLKTEGRTKVSLTDLLPEHMRVFVNNYRESHSFNCFNYAFRMDHPNIPVENTNNWDFINSAIVNDYKYLGDGEKLKFGDILFFRDSGKDGSHNIVHAAIYISDDLILHKPSKAIVGIPMPVIYESMVSAMRRYNSLPNPYGRDDDPLTQKGELYTQAFRKK